MSTGAVSPACSEYLSGITADKTRASTETYIARAINILCILSPTGILKTGTLPVFRNTLFVLAIEIPPCTPLLYLSFFFALYLS